MSYCNLAEAIAWRCLMKYQLQSLCRARMCLCLRGTLSGPQGV